MLSFVFFELSTSTQTAFIMGLSRKQAIIFYIVLLIVSLGVAYFPIGNGILIGLLIFTIVGFEFAYLLIIPYCCKKSPADSVPLPVRDATHKAQDDTKSTAVCDATYSFPQQLLLLCTYILHHSVIVRRIRWSHIPSGPRH